MAEFKILPDPGSLAREVTSIAIRELGQAIDETGLATWVLAGGSTPAAAYRQLAERPTDIDWNHVHVVMGDERCVPLDHADSNWRQAAELLLSQVPIPAEGQTPPPIELSPEAAAAQYEEMLLKLPNHRNNKPRLDHVWLGMGEDGHCLSLFPGRPELEITDRLVVPVHNSPKPPPDRISLTLGALQGARSCLIIAGGAGKAPAVARARAGDLTVPVALAARTVEQAGGKVTWLLDEAAAAR